MSIGKNSLNATDSVSLGRVNAIQRKMSKSQKKKKK